MDKETSNNIESLLDITKKLLILELLKNHFNRDDIRKVIGKVDNNQISAIASILKNKGGKNGG